MPSRTALLLAVAAAMGSASLLADDPARGVAHGDPIAPVLLGVTAILVFALVGRYTARRLGQPSVLGELMMGIIAGNLFAYLGWDFLIILREGPAVFDVIELQLAGMPLAEATARVFDDPNTAAAVEAIIGGPQAVQVLGVAHTVDMFSRYGVIFLLFLVGLDSSLDEMRQAGARSLRVAVVGMVAPFLLGLAVAWMMLPERSLGTELFIAATLGATSVGITAAVLRELDVLHTDEAHTILGAAVFDDVLGLISLAIVSGIVVSGGFDVVGMLRVIALSALFIVGAFWLGPKVIRGMVALTGRLNMMEAKLFVSFLFVMLLAWLADFAGLAPIIGAFAAGLILHDCYFQRWGESCETHPYRIKDLIAPLEAIAVPIFFVLIGVQVRLDSLLEPRVLLLALGLLAAAIVGKLASGLVAGRGVNRWTVGVGMLPRGEVGLIFAAIGRSLGVIDDQLFLAIVLMVIVTTLMAPPLLKLSIGRGPRSASDEEAGVPGVRR